MAEKDYKKLVETKSKQPENLYCVDCGTKSPKWASVRFGVFFCLDCAALHRSLGVYLDFVKSVNLDNWDKESYLPIEYGGNKRFLSYLESKGLKNIEIESRYRNSEVIEYSKELMSLIEKETGLILQSSEKKTSRGVVKPKASFEHKQEPEKASIYSSSALTSSLSNIGSAISLQVKNIKDKTIEYGSKIGTSVKETAKSLLEKKPEKKENNSTKTHQMFNKSNKKSDWS